MKLARVALLTGLFIVPAVLVSGCGDNAQKRSSMDNTVKNAKLILADLKTTFASGLAEAKAKEGGQDGRLGLMAILVTEKIPYMVNKRISDEAKKKPLQAKLDETAKFIDGTLVPKWTAAKASGKPEDAKALIPLMDQLDKQLDEINNLLP